jgi:hypothetical protein
VTHTRFFFHVLITLASAGVHLLNAFNKAPSPQDNDGGSPQLESFVSSRPFSQVLDAFLPEDNKDVLEQPLADEQEPQYNCAFWFLDCNFLSQDKEVWKSHSLSHFYGEEPPRSVICPLCAWEVSCDTGWDAWDLKAEHLLEQHLFLGETLRTARPDFHLFTHLWQKRLIDDLDLKELKGTSSCLSAVVSLTNALVVSYDYFTNFVSELFAAAILICSRSYGAHTARCFAQLR